MKARPTHGPGTSATAQKKGTHRFLEDAPLTSFRLSMVEPCVFLSIVIKKYILNHSSPVRFIYGELVQQCIGQKTPAMVRSGDGYD